MGMTVQYWTPAEAPVEQAPTTAYRPLGTCYATLSAVKRNCNIDEADTSHDADLLVILAGVSNSIDGYCNRHFSTRSESRYFDVVNPGRVFIDDVLSVSEAVCDSAGTGTHGETWTSQTDFILLPDNSWPKAIFAPTAWGTRSMSIAARYLKLTGVWGYGDGRGVAWKTTALTATVATTTATEVTVSDTTGLDVGLTILVESEQMFITGIGTLQVTVERGINGTAAAAHSEKAISLAAYPPAIELACVALSTMEYNVIPNGGLQSQWIGSFGWQAQAPKQILEIWDRLLGRFRRIPI
jgi:hypothetical protein